MNAEIPGSSSNLIVPMAVNGCIPVRSHPQSLSQHKYHQHDRDDHEPVRGERRSVAEKGKRTDAVSKSSGSLDLKDLASTPGQTCPSENGATSVSSSSNGTVKDSSGLPVRTYECCRDVPGSRSGKKMYPLLPIRGDCAERELHDRYHSIVAILKAIVDNDSILRDCASLIDYGFCMVGTTPANATPSIVVYTKKDNINRLRSVSKSNPIITKLSGAKTMGRFTNRAAAKYNTPLRLVYFETKNAPCERQAAEMLTVHITEEGLCGALVTVKGRVATLGILLDVDSELLGLTVDHLFNPPTDVNDSARVPVERALASTIGLDEHGSTTDIASFNDSSSGVEPLWIDDSEDEDLSRPATPPKAPEPLQVSAVQHTSETITKEEVFAVEGQMAEAPIQLPTTAPYLDWALIKLEKLKCLDEDRIFWIADALASPISAFDIASEPRYHGVPVTIIAGTSGLVTGSMLKVTSYIGSEPGQELCKAWTVALDSSSGM